MKRSQSQLFARPNLKMFVFAALIIVAVEHFFGAHKTDEASILAAASLSASPLRDADLEKLIDQAYENPSSDHYLLISECLRRRGDQKRAMHYLRKASFAAHLEDGDE